MHADHDRDRAGLAALMVFAHDQVAVLALRGHHGRDVLVVHLDAVGAVVDPAGVRILHDHHAAGADVVAAVMLVPARRRDLEQVNVIAAVGILQQRAALHRHRWNRLGLLHVVAPEADQVHLARIGGQAERDVDAAHAGQDVGDDAVTLRVTGDLVEHDGRAVARALVDVDDAADLPLALGAGDELELACRLELRQPDPQVLLGPRAFVRCGFLGAGLERALHGGNSYSSCPVILRWPPKAALEG